MRVKKCPNNPHRKFDLLGVRLVIISLMNTKSGIFTRGFKIDFYFTIRRGIFTRGFANRNKNRSYTEKVKYCLYNSTGILSAGVYLPLPLSCIHVLNHKNRYT